jgi:hypothetical protein
VVYYVVGFLNVLPYILGIVFIEIDCCMMELQVGELGRVLQVGLLVELATDVVRVVLGAFCFVVHGCKRLVLGRLPLVVR